MPFPINALPAPTPEQASGASIQNAWNGMLFGMGNTLAQIVRLINQNKSLPAASFWVAQGANGGAVLADLKAAISFLETYGPTHVTPQLTSFTANLVVAADGTVTIGAATTAAPASATAAPAAAVPAAATAKPAAAPAASTTTETAAK
jgi:hypothetical protein